MKAPTRREKVVDQISHGSEAVYAAEFAVDTFAAEPVPHRGTRLDRVELDAFGA